MSVDVLVCVENEERAVAYCEALRAAGLPAPRLEVLVPPLATGGLRTLAAEAAGLVLAGGPDMHPRHYGEEPLADAGLNIDEPLDRMELELMAGAEEGKTPVWALCRGMQTVNIHLGGTLYQDLPLQFPGVGEHAVEDPLDFLAHELETVSTESEFGEALARHGSAVNSRHHQAIKGLAPGLREVARAPDGVVEVIETESDEWWLRGVQWHPENLTAVPYQLQLWKEFLAATGASGGEGGSVRSAGARKVASPEPLGRPFPGEPT
jgi:putative glutamine amidotransferase